ncbi:MAG: hypothetical protein KGJ62_08160 [Armatimonadetes bacterium]|nr:hypothetical protein [Armatimonadota bacterium]MDE2205250.1 hypothetical protein [Armatimonadota bacterium]
MKQQSDVFASFEPIDDGFLRRDWTAAQLPASWLAASTELAIQRTSDLATRYSGLRPDSVHRLDWLPDRLPTLAVQFPCEIPPEERMPSSVLAAARDIAMRLFPSAREEELSDSAQLGSLGWPDRFDLTADIGRLSASMVFRDEAALREMGAALSGMLVRGPLTGHTPGALVTRIREFTDAVRAAVPCVVSVMTPCGEPTRAVDLSPVWATVAAGILLT